MKNKIFATIALAIVSAYVVSVSATPAEATYQPPCKPFPVCLFPTPTPAPSVEPTPAPTATPMPSATATPEPSVEPTESPSATPSAEPTTPAVVVTGGSDGRSDGRTESLGCQRASDNCNTAQNVSVPSNAVLPSTGSDNLPIYLGAVAVFGVVLALLGFVLRKIANNIK